eukprot:1481585-Rhodomonas_salina.3
MMRCSVRTNQNRVGSGVDVWDVVGRLDPVGSDVHRVGSDGMVSGGCGQAVCVDVEDVSRNQHQTLLFSATVPYMPAPTRPRSLDRSRARSFSIALSLSLPLARSLAQTFSLARSLTRSP